MWRGHLDACESSTPHECIQDAKRKRCCQWTSHRQKGNAGYRCANGYRHIALIGVRDRDLSGTSRIERVFGAALRGTAKPK